MLFRSRGIADAGGQGHAARWRVDLAPPTTAAASAPVAGWYTERWGTEFIRTFDARCRRTFENCRIAAGPQPGDLYYTFDHAGVAGTVAFPPEFPDDAPMLVLAGREVTLEDLRPGLSHVDLASVLVTAITTSQLSVGASVDVIVATGEVPDGLERSTAAEA